MQITLRPGTPPADREVSCRCRAALSSRLGRAHVVRVASGDHADNPGADIVVVSRRGGIAPSHAPPSSRRPYERWTRALYRRRRVHPSSFSGEITGIKAAAGHFWLEGAQLPEISLTVSGRTLEIANSSLIAVDLAPTIAGLLAHLIAEDATQAHSSAGDLADHEQAEECRLATCNALIVEILLAAAGPSAEQAQLGLARIATGLLPSAPGTEADSPGYTVAAEFTRAPAARDIRTPS